MTKINVKDLSLTEKKELIEEVAQGHSQWSVLYDLVTYGVTSELNAYMKAPRHSANYVRSYQNAIKRLQDRITDHVEHVPGIYGGGWTSYFKIV